MSAPPSLFVVAPVTALSVDVLVAQQRNYRLLRARNAKNPVEPPRCLMAGHPKGNLSRGEGGI